MELFEKYEKSNFVFDRDAMRANGAGEYAGRLAID